MIEVDAKARAVLREFARWLEQCSGLPVLVRVQGVEGGCPYDRTVSITDAVTDFLTQEEKR